MEFSDKVADYVLEKGYDPQYGARPLRRAIQNELEDFLADEYLEGHIKTMTEFFSILTMESQLLRKQKRRKSRKIQQTHSR